MYTPVGNNVDRIVHCARISRNVIPDFMEDFCMNADYYKLDKAEQLIDERITTDGALVRNMPTVTNNEYLGTRKQLLKQVMKIWDGT